MIKAHYAYHVVGVFSFHISYGLFIATRVLHNIDLSKMFRFKDNFPTVHNEECNAQQKILNDKKWLKVNEKWIKAQSNSE
jgi:hypothetical protein